MRLEADLLVRRAGGRAIVDGVSLAVADGEFLALVGPNGSGKSTLLSLLAGLRRPHAGTVRLGGRDLRSLPRGELARTLALVAQQAETAERLTGRQVVELGRTPHLGLFSAPSETDAAVVDRALDAVGMTPLAHRVWQSLSGGERQRLHIARALAQTPRILVLDEPTNHLDIEHQLGLLALVRSLGITVLAALHDLNHAAMFADRVAVLRDGRLAALGPPSDVLTPERLRALFGVEAEIDRAPDGRPRIRYRRPETEGRRFALEL